jgi:hypothetical protein
MGGLPACRSLSAKPRKFLVDGSGGAAFILLVHSGCGDMLPCLGQQILHSSLYTTVNKEYKAQNYNPPTRVCSDLSVLSTTQLTKINTYVHSMSKFYINQTATSLTDSPCNSTTILTAVQIRKCLIMSFLQLPP